MAAAGVSCKSSADGESGSKSHKTVAKSGENFGADSFIFGCVKIWPEIQLLQQVKINELRESHLEKYRVTLFFYFFTREAGIMAKPNQDIRDSVRSHGLCTYEVAATLNISTPLLFQWLQRDLSQEKRARILAAIHETAERKKIEA